MLDYRSGRCYNAFEVMKMNTGGVILELRTKNGMSQDELAKKVFVTRQAVSRWETGVSQT